MNTQNQNIQNLIDECQSVAKKNKESFSYKIVILTRPHGMRFGFQCHEDSDYHVFVQGYGDTIEEAVANAHKDVPDAIEEWGYEKP